MFDLLGVSKRFGALSALEPTDLSLPPGKTTALIGPSGCGKSTLIRLLAGLVLPDAGQIRFGGEPIDPAHLTALRRRIGYVIQDGGLFPHLTGLGNVSLLPRCIGWDEARRRRRVGELCELARLDPRVLQRYPAEMSGGQKQRVSLIRALMLDPDVLLLDEPMGALDPMIRFELQNDLRDAFERLGKTVLLVTHDLSEAAFFASLVVLMRDGHIIQRGPIDDLLRRPADEFVVRFIRAQRPALSVTEGAP